MIKSQCRRDASTPLGDFFSILLDVLVEVDPDKHAQDTDDINFNGEAQSKFQQDEIDGERGIDTGRKVR